MGRTASLGKGQTSGGQTDRERQFLRSKPPSMLLPVATGFGGFLQPSTPKVPKLEVASAGALGPWDSLATSGRATLHLVSPQSPVMWDCTGTFAGPHLHSSDGDGGAGALREGGHGLGGAAGRADVVHRHIHLGKTDGQRVRAGQPRGSCTPSLPLPKTAAVSEPAPAPPRAQRCHQRSHI